MRTAIVTVGAATTELGARAFDVAAAKATASAKRSIAGAHVHAATAKGEPVASAAPLLVVDFGLRLLRRRIASDMV